MWLLKKWRDFDACVSLHHSWQPERQLPFSDVRLPPPTDYHKDIGEGEEVEVWPFTLHSSVLPDPPQFSFYHQATRSRCNKSEGSLLASVAFLADVSKMSFWLLKLDYQPFSELYFCKKPRKLKS